MVVALLRPLIYTLGPLINILVWNAGKTVFFGMLMIPWFLEVSSAKLLFSLLTGWYFVAIVLRGYTAEEDSNVIAGRKLYSPKQVDKALSGTSKNRPFYWGGLNLPAEHANYHFYAMGSSGSGKTLTLEMLLNSILPHFRTKLAKRILFFDAKKEIVPVLAGAGLKSQRDYFILHPFDKRAVAWDIAVDVTTSPTALQVASAFVPVSSTDGQPFFPESARKILHAVFVSLMKTQGKQWTLQTVIEKCSRLDSVRSCVKESPLSTAIVGSDLDQDKQANDVLATLRNPLGKLRDVAKAWEGKPRISFHDWLSQDTILILPCDRQVRETLQAFVAVAVEILATVLESESKQNPDFTWLFFDELKEAGKLESLASILSMGRSYGLCTVLGFQDLDGLATVYKDEEIHSILNNCSTKAFFRLEGRKSAEYASGILGDIEVLDESFSESIGDQRSTSTSFQKRVKRSVMPEQFYTIPEPGPENGLTGYYTVRTRGLAYKGITPWADVLKQLPERDDSEPKYDGIDLAGLYENQEAVDSNESANQKTKGPRIPTTKVDEESVPLTKEENPLLSVGLFSKKQKDGE